MNNTNAVIETATADLYISPSLSKTGKWNAIKYDLNTKETTIISRGVSKETATKAIENAAK